MQTQPPVLTDVIGKIQINIYEVSKGIYNASLIPTEDCTDNLDHVDLEKYGLSEYRSAHALMEKMTAFVGERTTETIVEHNGEVIVFIRKCFDDKWYYRIQKGDQPGQLEGGYPNQAQVLAICLNKLANKEKTYFYELNESFKEAREMGQEKNGHVVYACVPQENPGNYFYLIYKKDSDEFVTISTETFPTADEAISQGLASLNG